MDSHTSLYVHVPFCVVKCGYCDFNSFVAKDHGELDRFLDALDRELDLARPPRQPCSVFIGGGTPSHLDPPRLIRLLEILNRHVALRSCAEVTMEANPESLTRDKAAIALEHGVNRISMGAQSFAAHHLRFLDRAHSADQTRAAFDAVRHAGCTNASVDLMFGMPGQTLVEWDADLDQALALSPDHLSCYNLTWEQGTRLWRDLNQGKVQRNDEEVERDMFVHTRSKLAAAGFVAYEISNFAGRGGPCRHNDHYWLQGDYVGVGPGAASHRAGVRTMNLKALHAWADAVARGLPAAASAETLTRRQRAAEALWLGVRRSEGIDVDAVGSRLQAPVRAWFGDAMARLEQDELVTLGERLRLTPRGVLFANTVGERLLEG